MLQMDPWILAFPFDPPDLAKRKFEFCQQHRGLASFDARNVEPKRGRKDVKMGKKKKKRDDLLTKEQIGFLDTLEISSM